MTALRDKAATTRERVEMAPTLKNVLSGRGVLFVINDDVEAAVAADAKGAPIGQGDITPAQACALLKSSKILGPSCETSEMVRAADPSLLDCLGLALVFRTAIKADHEVPIGFEGLASPAALLPLPTVAIDEFKAKHERAVRQSGADGLAVVSAICSQPDVTVAAQTFAQKEVFR